MVRYPHTGILKYSDNKTTTDADGNPVVDLVEVELNECRVQMASGNKNLDYKAKVFCSKLVLEAFKVDGATFVYEGMSFKILQLFNYQRHCEIWLD